MKTQTAEEYFRNNYSSSYDNNNNRICELTDCFDAMQSYANNHAIEFAEWLGKNKRLCKILKNSEKI